MRRRRRRRLFQSLSRENRWKRRRNTSSRIYRWNGSRRCREKAVLKERRRMTFDMRRENEDGRMRLVLRPRELSGKMLQICRFLLLLLLLLFAR
jgi:hypothetical protein